MKPDETISIKDAFTCKHLLPCGLCEKTDKLCTRQIQKRRYACLDAKCKDCGTVFRVFFNPSDDRVEADIVARYKTQKCECGGAFEISPSYIVDERGNAI